MALGYENTGTGPRLIANAGNVMTESIRRLGEQVQQHIYQNNVNQQGMQYLQDVSTLDFKSPDFPAKMAGVMAKYPMAPQSQGAVIGSRLLMNGWEQEQSRLTAETNFDRQKELIDYRAKAANPLYGGGPNGLNLDLPALPTGGESDMIGAGNRVMGAMSPLGIPFNPQTEVPRSEEPDLMQDIRPAHNALLARGIDRDTGNRVMGNVIQRAAVNRLRPAVKENVTLYQDEEGNDYEWGAKTGWLSEPPPDGTTVFKPGTQREQFKSVGGVLVNPKTKERIDPGISQAKQATIDAQKEANTDRDASLSLKDREAKVKELDSQRADYYSAYQASMKRGDTTMADSQWKKWQDTTDAILKLQKGELKAAAKSEFATAEAVRSAYKAGEITKEKAREILSRDFGL